MKTSKEVTSDNNGKVQIADNRKGGNSSWGEKGGHQESSIRLAWYNDGKFDPISSAELPMWGLKDLVEIAAKEDMFNKAELAETIGSLTASIYRQT